MTSNSCSAVSEVFRDPTSLPQLHRLCFYQSIDASVEEMADCDVTAVVAALATVEVGVSGRPRPGKGLLTDIPAARGVLPAAALMPGLTHLRCGQLTPGWLRGWTEW